MARIAALFWDVGGVLLSNGWDTSSRRAAAERFGLDWDVYASRHDAVVEAFETGRLSLAEYLQHTVFHETRRFSEEDFRRFMFDCSQPREETLELARRLAADGRHFMATLNNESMELNQYRIERFRLPQLFRAFFSSSFLGVMKPHPTLYRRALWISQVPAEEALFIDDREKNVEAARAVGMHAVHYRGAPQLGAELEALGCAPRR